MTHEIRHLFQTLAGWQQSGTKAVFVSVVDLEGQSYRRPGVRMVINENGEPAGAVSGGCIEQEIFRQAESVFSNGVPKIMTYDGRLRIGCEGILYILIEPVFITGGLEAEFYIVLDTRQKFSIDTYYSRQPGSLANAGSIITLNGKSFPLNPAFDMKGAEGQVCFTQVFDPLFRLYIFGAEHDAVQLCKAARLIGWEVVIVATAEESKSCDYFPGAASLITPAFEKIDTSGYDDQTAIVLMTHSFSKDVQYLMALKECKPAYLGIVGSYRRRERLFSILLDHFPDTPVEFLEQVHGPAGLSIGAENAAEIAVSILAEILSAIRHQVPESLRDRKGAIHG
jgi:xanthine dehydrogenase accessory factor